MSIVIFSIIVYYFVNRKVTRVEDNKYITVKNLKNPTENQIIATLQTIKNTYGKDIALNVEKIFRLESGHFSSEIYKKTNGAGITAGNLIFPYGWNFIQPAMLKYKPIGVIFVPESNLYFLQFRSTDAFFIVAEILKNRKRTGYFYSLNDLEAADYENKLNTIQNLYL